MKTKSFAETELEILVKSSKEDDRPIIEEFIPEILALCEKFNKTGQSGGSAPYTAGALSSAIKKLCLQEPICPITGIDEEWGTVADNLNQNNRCYSLFRNEDKKSYYLDAIIFRDDTIGNSGSIGWDTFTGTVEDVLSRQFIKGFPFTPKTFYIDVTREKYDKEKHGENARVITTGMDGDVVYFIKDRKQLDEVFEYYLKS